MTTGNGLRISKAVMDKMSEANAFTVVMDAKIHGIDAGSYPTWLDINAGVGKNEGNDYFLVSLLTFADTPGEFNAQLLADEYGIPRSEAVRIHNGTGSSACIGKWVQLAFLMEGSTAKIYVDGKLAGEGDFKCDVTKLFSGGAAKREMNMTLGTPSCWPDGAMDAALDNVEIYDRALTEAQLKALRPTRAAISRRRSVCPLRTTPSTTARSPTTAATATTPRLSAARMATSSPASSRQRDTVWPMS